jgi:U3 small nucleolar RNA-associated protein 14
LEKRLAEALGESKNVLTNEDLYTEEEKELLKAMDLKEAKKRTTELQKMRALMSFTAAKQAREARIKSKK